MGQCCVRCRQEFRLKNFGLSGTHPARFALFQWRCAPALYILYRLALMIYADFWLIYTAAGFVDFGFQSGQKNDSKSQDNNISTLENGTIFIPYAWPVYLTNWTYLLLSLYLTVHALVAIWYLVRSPLLMFKPLQPHHHRQLFQELNTTPSLWENSYDIIMDSKDSVANTRSSVVPWYFKLTWVLYNMASAGSATVTAMFFIFLWPLFASSTIGQMNLQLHGINSVIILIEHLVSAVPYRLLHYVYALSYGLAYLIFSAIFYAAGNDDPIYPILDWTNPGFTMIIVVLVGFVVLPLLQVFFFVIYKVRLCLFDALTRQSEGASISDEGSPYKNAVET